MSNSRREKRKLMRQFGVMDSIKKKSFSERIEEGKKTQRENLQRIKNESIKREIERGSGVDTNPDFPIYRGIDNEYSFFGNFLNSKNWEILESNGDDGVED
jgi:hypothetical protein